MPDYSSTFKIHNHFDFDLQLKNVEVIFGEWEDYDENPISAYSMKLYKLKDNWGQ